MYKENQKALLYAFIYTSIVYALLHVIVAYCRAVFSGAPLLNDVAILLAQFNVHAFFLFSLFAIIMHRENYARNNGDIKKHTGICLSVVISIILALRYVFLHLNRESYGEMSINLIIFKESVDMALKLAIQGLALILTFMAISLFPRGRTSVRKPLMENNKEKACNPAHIQATSLIIAAILCVLLYLYKGIFAGNLFLKGVAFVFIQTALNLMFFGLIALNIMARVRVVSRLSEPNNNYLLLFIGFFFMAMFIESGGFVSKVLA